MLALDADCPPLIYEHAVDPAPTRRAEVVSVDTICLDLEGVIVCSSQL
jgi:hypothetical protein